MNKYTIVITEQAQIDLRSLSDTIKYQYNAPITSIKYLRGIYSDMKKLSHNAESFTIQTRKSLQQYGPSPRRLN